MYCNYKNENYIYNYEEPKLVTYICQIPKYKHQLKGENPETSKNLAIVSSGNVTLAMRVTLFLF